MAAVVDPDQLRGPQLLPLSSPTVGPSKRMYFLNLLNFVNLNNIFIHCVFIAFYAGTGLAHQRFVCVYKICDGEMLLSSLGAKKSIYVFPQKEQRGLSPNFHIHVSVSHLYIPRIGQPIFPAAEYADRLWEYTIRTQKHECRIWDCGRAVPVLGIYVSNFLYSVFQCRVAQPTM